MKLKNIHYETLAIVLISIIALLFFYPVFLGRQPIPSDSLVGLYHPWRDVLSGQYPRGVPYKNFLITDPIRQQIPWRKLAMAGWANGVLPSWNPYSFLGVPLMSNIQAAVFYPFNILFYLFEFSSAWTVLIISQPIIAGIFMYLFLRNMDMERLPSTLGALVWSFSGFQIAWLTWGTIDHVSLWLPLILLSVDRIMRHAKNGNIKRILLWSILQIFSLSFSFFAGHAQVSLYVFTVSFLYMLWKMVGSKSIAYVLFVNYILAIIITSVQWIPLIGLLQESNRINEVSSWFKEGWFLPWKNLVQFFVPDFFGNPSTLNYWGTWNYGEFIGYIGVIPLALAIYALFVSKESSVKIWIFFLFISLLFMLPNPVSKFPYRLGIYAFSALQPTRLMVIVDFSLAILAAVGLNYWVREKALRWEKVLILFGLFYVLLFVLEISLGMVIKNSSLLSNLEISRRNTIFPFLMLGFCIVISFISKVLIRWKHTAYIPQFLLVVVVCIDIFRFGWKFTPFSERKYFFPETKTIQFLQNQQKPYRVISYDDELFPPNTLSYYGVESISGYDPIYIQRFEEFMAASERGIPDASTPYGFNRIITPKNISSPLFPLLNIKYVLSLEPLNQPNLVEIMTEGRTRLYEYSRSLPRAYFVDAIIAENDKQKILQDLFRESDEKNHTAFVEGITENSLKVDSSRGSVEIIRFQEQSMALRSYSQEDKFMVVSAQYEPRWRAYIDGIEQRVYRANYTFMGIIVPKGNHVIEFSYTT